jgi:phospholipid/cholesterol/gamma-HCH transport system substrate-binding protein
VLDVSLGSPDNDMVSVNALIPSFESMDLIDIFAGRRMNKMLTSLMSMSENLKIVMDAFSDSTRTRTFIKTLDQLSPLIMEVRGMAHEMSAVGHDLNQEHRMRETLERIQRVTEDVAQITPQLVKMMKDSPDAGKDMSKIIKNMAALTESMSTIIPALAEVAPDLPRASHRAIEAMDEAVVTLKAMQKSWVLSGKVDEVKAEEARRTNTIQPTPPIPYAMPQLTPLRVPASVDAVQPHSEEAKPATALPGTHP